MNYKLTQFDQNNDNIILIKEEEINTFKNNYKLEYKYKRNNIKTY